MDSFSKMTEKMARTMTNYGAVVVSPTDRQQRVDTSNSGCCHYRLLLYLMIFLAGSISYALRVGLSQALVAMVNHTSHDTSTNVSDDQCPRDVPFNTSDDVTAGGDFDWDRSEQGSVLAAFYYGYALMQVNYIHKSR